MIFSVDDCVDKIRNCFWYDNDLCFGANEMWARKNCPKRCGFCGSKYTYMFI